MGGPLSAYPVPPGCLAAAGVVDRPAYGLVDTTLAARARTPVPRRRVSNQPADERPGAASDGVTRRRPRYADDQTERPARPRAGRIPFCSSTPPSSRTPEAPRTPGSVTSTLHRGVFSILRLQGDGA